MQRTFTDLFDTKHTFFTQKTQQSMSKDGLFSCKKHKETKDSFLDRMKKGTLFRLSTHLKPQLKITSKDPFLNWLEQNSTFHIEEDQCKREMGETYFYLNTEEIEKQKKLKKPILPTIEKFKTTQTQLHSPCKSRRQETSSFCLKNQKIKEPRILSEFKLKKHKSDLIKQKKQLRSQQKIKKYQKHKLKCFEQNLSQTQLFPKQINHSFYSNKENLIKSQFYLNDHKKKHGFQTFYIKPKVKIETDQDLQRVKGLQKVVVRSFDQNLRKLEKQVSLSCYDEVSTYFRTMKSQVNEILQNGRHLRKQRITCKDHRQKVNIEKLRPKITLKSLKELKEQSRENIQQKIENHLPEFLLKTITFPNKQSLYRC